MDSVDITLKNFMTESMNKKLILFIVEFNQIINSPIGDSSSGDIKYQLDNYDINMLLLDKVFEF